MPIYINANNGKILSKSGKVTKSIIPPPSLPAGALVYYPFDETSGLVANDESGNERDGALNGGVSWGSGYLNWGGANGYVDMPTLGLDNYDDAWSMSTWIFPNTTAGFRMIFSNGTGDVSAAGNFSLYAALLNSTNVLSIQIEKAQVGGIGMSSGVGIARDIWHHLVITYSGSGDAAGVRAYLNGSNFNLNTDSEIALTSVGAIDDWVVGSYSGVSKGGSAWAGFQDNFLMYGRVLTAGEVETIYEIGR